jgi:hypothetical protein
VADGVALLGYAVAPAPTGAPVTRAPSAADVTLLWKLHDGWPAGLGVSLRPTRGGAFIADGTGAIIQRDAGAPGQGLASAAGVVHDALRVPLPAGADGVMLIVYRTTDVGFENLLEKTLDISALDNPGAQQ